MHFLKHAVCEIYFSLSDVTLLLDLVDVFKEENFAENENNEEPNM